MAGWLLALIALVYVALLFAVAWYGDHRGAQLREKWRAVIYSLSLAVYCTAWTYFGAVGQASQDLWSFVPIYLGPALVFVIFWKLLSKLILVSKQENITSIADFIASRHGKSRWLAIMVTSLLVVGTLPYIALQLKAIVTGFDLLSFSGLNGWTHEDMALSVTLLLVVFVIMFGTRHLDTTEHQYGVMTAIAFESILKLVAFLIVGGWITYKFFATVEIPSLYLADAVERTRQELSLSSMLIPSFMAMASIICLPREFHVLVVENSNVKDLNKARWMFPLYLLLSCMFVLPMALAGNAWLGSSISPDAYVIALPRVLGSEGMALLAYMAGVSAAISMVIVATIALSTMISNEILMPMILRKSYHGRQDYYRFSGLLLNVRRSTIIGILLMAYVVYRIINESHINSLAGLGMISFAAVAQLLPAIVGSLYLKETNKKAVGLGLTVGSLVWFYTLIVPLFAEASGTSASLLNEGLFGIYALRPESLFGLEFTGNVNGASALAFSLNLILYLLGCVYFRVDPLEKRQARRFVDVSLSPQDDHDYKTVTVQELSSLVGRFLGEQRARQLVRSFHPSTPTTVADSEMVAATERMLAGVMGASSAKVLMKTALSRDEIRFEDVEAMVDETSEVIQFNRELLSGAIEHIDQGISVVDSELRLVAWNQRYLELFSYPEGLIKVGRPVADIIRYNASKGLCGAGEIEDHVRKRVSYMKRGQGHKSERVRNNGQVIEMHGNPMPAGGFVMSFTDITEFRQVESALKDVNESLEQRVEERTRELYELNKELLRAKSAAERANSLRSRFFAAVSHDLMQPMNAARLFTSTLETVVTEKDQKELVSHLTGSLKSSEDLIRDLLDMSRLEAGKLTASVKDFPLSDILGSMKAEFTLLAKEQGIEFRLRESSEWISSDPVLLRRVLQNFLTNAFRYCNPDHGRIILACRKRAGKLQLEVRDNGPGIPEDKKALIFGEFERLHQDAKGLGLGLSIAQGIANVLGHGLKLDSKEGKGAVFAVTVNLAERKLIQKQTYNVIKRSKLTGLKVLCVDNEDDILKGMNALLSRWGCDVSCAATIEEAISLLNDGLSPDILLMDYRLEQRLNGIELIEEIRRQLDIEMPAILISADKQGDIVSECREKEIDFLAKPVKPASLRALMNARAVVHS
ncbi:hybrid sensor histidine kinase/response regulator [Endozoicomonas sp. OPT23]|uniref:hybrid sensor histidine kinase/response regulator n=1 Tax=Endozoicomonas sp. OPT23 TaxID=2072845 RepID=UPI00129BAF91|nr:PAS domain-containing hybrid sensor histidine kinase/response regulator [Endozoicomonas sp. OPT23]MRI35046.1 hybrid sensor histidine kinase/response regulator [Endozoicomonas sp. OPT23]